MLMSLYTSSARNDDAPISRGNQAGGLWAGLPFGCVPSTEFRRLQIYKPDNVRDNPVAANKLKINTGVKCDLGSSHCYPTTSGVHFRRRIAASKPTLDKTRKLLGSGTAVPEKNKIGDVPLILAPSAVVSNSSVISVPNPSPLSRKNEPKLVVAPNASCGCPETKFQ